MLFLHLLNWEARHPPKILMWKSFILQDNQKVCIILNDLTFKPSSWDVKLTSLRRCYVEIMCRIGGLLISNGEITFKCVSEIESESDLFPVSASSSGFAVPYYFLVWITCGFAVIFGHKQRFFHIGSRFNTHEELSRLFHSPYQLKGVRAGVLMLSRGNGPMLMNKDVPRF